MKFKIVGKDLVLTDFSHKIIKGENSFDKVEIIAPRYHDDCDLSELSFRFSEISEDGKRSAVQVLRQEKCDDKFVYLSGEITSDFSVITGNVIFMLTGIDAESVAAKFQSVPYTISDDISLMSMPDYTAAEQLFNQTQLEVQKAVNAADNTAKMLDEFTIDIAAENTAGGILSGGDISVSENGNVTVQSVNGKTLGTSVPENAVFTDTVYKLPNATTKTLGGVKVDGTSITVNGKGIISAVGGKNADGKVILPIASTEILGGVKPDGKTINADSDGVISVSESVSKMQDLAVQIAHPNNFLIYDNTGNPSVMVAIPKFYLDEVIKGASHTVHPAFIINGVEHDVIYISKYQNVVNNDRAYSLPMKIPATNADFDQAWNYCKNKGAGWHLMTNAEWAAIALWCKKNGTIPKGNSYYGKEVSEQALPQKAISAIKGSDGKTNKVFTGSGPENWYHNNTFSGIADLIGNVHEWSSGIRLNDGEIQIIPNNDAADWNNSCAKDSPLWRAVKSDGSIVSANSENTLKYDWISESVTVSTSITNKSSGTRNCQFGELKKDSALTIPEILKSFTLFPIESETYENDRVYVINSEEQLMTRGGNWTNGVATGLFRINLDNKRTKINASTGFRCAYYDPNTVI